MLVANWLVVTGPMDRRQAFVDEMVTRYHDEEDNEDITLLLDFNKIIPLVGDAGETWGCEQPFHVECSHGEQQTTYAFLTRWDPPNRAWLDAVCKKLPCSLVFAYNPGRNWQHDPTMLKHTL